MFHTYYFYIALLPSIILHEVSHGWVANFFGDPTAKNAKRLSLNPMRHIDPFGTILMPAVLVALHFPRRYSATPVRSPSTSHGFADPDNSRSTSHSPDP